VWHNSPIPGNCPVFNLSSPLPDNPDISMYKIDKEQDVEDGTFKEIPDPSFGGR
jgi:hypothetical protein